MSMGEALRSLRGKAPWLNKEEDAAYEAPTPPTPIEEARTLIELTQAAGNSDRHSGTWNAVSRWAAKELILTQRALETATDERGAMLRARAKTLRDVLAMDERAESFGTIDDSGPYVP